MWKSLLSTLSSAQPHLARVLVDAKLRTPEAERYWQDSIEILANASPNEQLLNDTILWRVRRGLLEKGLTFQNDAARSLIRRRYWVLVDGLDEDSKLRLFDAISKDSTHSEVTDLLLSGLLRQGHDTVEGSITWITNTFLQHILTTGALNPDFGRAVNDVSLKQTLGTSLAAAVVADWHYLSEFPTIWNSMRLHAKSSILSHLRGGLHAALLNVRNDSPLQLSLTRLSQSLDEWEASDTPLLQAELKITLPFQLPESIKEDRGTLEAYFRQQPKHPHDLALFLGTNPWIFRYLFGEKGNWPNPDVLLASVCKSFVFISNLRVRASANAENITRAIIADLGTNIRSILGDIETDMAGYFIFRDVLGEAGLLPVAQRLGVTLNDIEERSDRYRVIREPGRLGRLRVLSSGLRTTEKILDPAIVMQSGAENDRD